MTGEKILMMESGIIQPPSAARPRPRATPKPPACWSFLKTAPISIPVAAAPNEKPLDRPDPAAGLHSNPQRPHSPGQSPYGAHESQLSNEPYPDSTSPPP